eukprot:560170-Amphidinium_carterae.1
MGHLMPPPARPDMGPYFSLKVLQGLPPRLVAQSAALGVNLPVCGRDYSSSRTGTATSGCASLAIAKQGLIRSL